MAGHYRATVDGSQMRIAVVHPASGWILSRLSEELCAAAPETFFMALKPSPDRLHFPRPFDAIFYVDVQNCWGSLMRDLYPNAIHVGFFTHLDQDSDNAFRPDWSKLDGVVHMARRYYDRFLQAGWYPAERMAVIPPGQVVDRFPLRPLRLGVCQRGGFPGKGDPFLFEALAELPIQFRRCVHVIIKGSGWKPSLERSNTPPASSRPGWASVMMPFRVEIDEDESPNGYQDFYGKIDYLLIPSLWEGGPMALLEALACGVPVIAADVGWVPEMIGGGAQHVVRGSFVGNIKRGTCCWTYPPGDGNSLRYIISELVQERLDRRAQVEGLSWKSYAEKLEAFVETLR
mgnify:CR=1 FL=1